MWRLKQLIPKDQAGLEGKTVEVGALRLQIRSTIAQGGFSRVYLARDGQSGKLFALKHIICIDSESLDLVKKEVLALKAFRGHPNIITLESQSMYDMGGTKECFLVMEYCEKMMVDVLDGRGAGYYEEKQLLLMFRDVCNAVYAMHCQTPPVAHRDLKAENLLLGSDGQWKLCDFGSVSTNHRRFEKASEMGVEEDIIRKHTTPAYRAPEMWDLYRRDIVCEKVDIWALGCLLYRMAYLKSAFDGESKLQILNGNYRLPDLPKYSSIVTGLIKDMLNSSPDARPNAMQVWQRVNNALPQDWQKSGPDKTPASMSSQDNGKSTVQGRKPSVMPTRTPPPPPKKGTGGTFPSLQKESDHNSQPNAGKGETLGLFWSTSYAQDASYDDEATRVKDKAGSELFSSSKVPSLKGTQGASGLFSEPQSAKTESAMKGGSSSTHPSLQSNKNHGGDTKWDDDYDNGHAVQNRGFSSIGASPKVTHVGTVTQTAREGFGEFVADFQNAAIFTLERKDTTSESWYLEMENLRKEIKQLQGETLEIATKCEKLTSICRSQKLEIEELKSALATAKSQCASSQAKEYSFEAQRTPAPALSPQKADRQSGTIWDHEGGGLSPSVWRTFNDDVFKMEDGKHSNSSTGFAGDVRGLHESFTPPGTVFTAIKDVRQGSEFEGVSAVYDGNSSKGASCSFDFSQPAGWTGF